MRIRIRFAPSHNFTYHSALYRISAHCANPHHITSQNSKLYEIKPNCINSHYSTLHWNLLYYYKLNHIAQSYTVLHYIKLHYTKLFYTLRNWKVSTQVPLTINRWWERTVMNSVDLSWRTYISYCFLMECFLCYWGSSKEVSKNY